MGSTKSGCNPKEYSLSQELLERKYSLMGIAKSGFESKEYSIKSGMTFVKNTQLS